MKCKHAGRAKVASRVGAQRGEATSAPSLSVGGAHGGHTSNQTPPSYTVICHIQYSNVRNTVKTGVVLQMFSQNTDLENDCISNHLKYAANPLGSTKRNA